MAASRLKKLNKSQQQVNDLEEHMEIINYKHQQELDSHNEDATEQERGGGGYFRQ
jgi:hypothetical protein